MWHWLFCREIATHLKHVAKNMDRAREELVILFLMEKQNHSEHKILLGTQIVCTERVRCHFYVTS